MINLVVKNFNPLRSDNVLFNIHSVTSQKK